MITEKRRASLQDEVLYSLERDKRQKSNSGRAISRSIKEISLKVIAAIYWDLNCSACFYNIICDAPSQSDLECYNNMDQATRRFIDRFIWDHRIPQPRSKFYRRCFDFVSDFGWKLFSICAHAEAFRFACEEDAGVLEAEWHSLMQIINENQRSIEIFARARGLPWQYPLLRHTIYDLFHLPDLHRALAPEIDLGRDHHHQIVLMPNGRLRRPRYQHHAQVNIQNHVYDPYEHGGAPNPLFQNGVGIRCELCQNAPEACECRVVSLAGDLIELVEYPGKGVGVRALSSFKTGDLLDEYLGQLLTDRTQDEDWSVEFAGTSIDSHHFGNWPRFINHSCDYNTEFEFLRAGKTISAVVEVKRDVPIFSEITVDYGEAYWEGKKCLCGSESCISLYGPSSMSGWSTSGSGRSRSERNVSERTGTDKTDSRVSGDGRSEAAESEAGQLDVERPSTRRARTV